MPQKIQIATDKPPNVDVLTEQLDYKEDRGRDLRAFQLTLERERSISEPRSLFRVLATGPLQPKDASAFAELYRRGISEVRAFFTHSEKKQ